MTPLPEPNPPAPQGRARPSAPAGANESDPRGAQPAGALHGPDSNESPGLPWFRTWRDVYLFVLGGFVLYVVLLTIFSRAFS